MCVCVQTHTPTLAGGDATFYGCPTFRRVDMRTLPLAPCARSRVIFLSLRVYVYVYVYTDDIDHHGDSEQGGGATI